MVTNALEILTLVCSSFQIFLCCPIMCLYLLSSVLLCSLRFPHENDVRFVFTSSCLQEGSCLIYVICVCLCIVVFNTYYIVSLPYLSSSCMTCVASFSGLSIFDYSIFSNVYLINYIISGTVQTTIKMQISNSMLAMRFWNSNC